VYGKLYDTEFLWRYANFCKSRGLLERAEVHYLYSLDLDPNYALCLADYAKFLAEAGGILALIASHSSHRIPRIAFLASIASLTFLSFLRSLYDSMTEVRIARCHKILPEGRASGAIVSDYLN
jgi:hypothetical protein